MLEGLLISFAISVVAEILEELVSSKRANLQDFLRKHLVFSTEKAVKYVRLLILVLVFIFSIAFFILLLYLSLFLIEQAMASDESPFSYRIVCAVGSFSLALIALHCLAYCFGGYLKRQLLDLWPKGIDYIYYLFGTLLLLVVMAQLYNQSELMLAALRWEIMVGVYLLNLKLLKTSVEVFPGLFSPQGVLVRDISGKKIY